MYFCNCPACIRYNARMAESVTSYPQRAAEAANKPASLTDKENTMTTPKTVTVALATSAVIDPSSVFVLVAFKFGTKFSRTGGIVYGLRFGPPKDIKASADFPGTFYKIVTEKNVPEPKKTYRYVPLAQVASFLANTKSNAAMLDRIMGPFGAIPQTAAAAAVAPKPKVTVKVGDRLTGYGESFVVTEDYELMNVNTGRANRTLVSADKIKAAIVAGTLRKG